MSDSFLDAVRATDAYRRGVAAARAALATAHAPAKPVDNVNEVPKTLSIRQRFPGVTFSEWEPSTPEEWAGKARMAEARRAAGAPLSPMDRKALRRGSHGGSPVRSDDARLDLGGVA